MTSLLSTSVMLDRSRRRQRRRDVELAQAMSPLAQPMIKDWHGWHEGVFDHRHACAARCI
ncbi:hypothetical protein ACNKHP_08390 [Shigella boydii]